MYVPVVNLNEVTKPGNTFSAPATCFEYNTYRGDHMYWSIQADAVAQAITYAFYRKPAWNFQGGILHFRYGYSFWKRHQNLSHGLLLDVPVRAAGYGLGGGWFMKWYNPGTSLFLIPMVNAGTLFFDPITLRLSAYASAEIEVVQQLGPQWGMSLKPYYFITSSGRQEYGLKLGFNRMNRPKSIPE